MSLRSNPRHAGTSQAELSEEKKAWRNHFHWGRSWFVGNPQCRRDFGRPGLISTACRGSSPITHSTLMGPTRGGCPFPESRARQIRDVLSSEMKDHVREARFQGKPTSLKRFLGNAMLAIATYQSRSLRSHTYDRRRAIKLLKEERLALCAFQRTLERTVEWKQLDRYLERLFVADRKQKKRQHDEREGRRPDAKLNGVRALLRRRKLADRYRKEFRARSLGEFLRRLKFRNPHNPGA